MTKALQACSPWGTCITGSFGLEGDVKAARCSLALICGLANPAFMILLVSCRHRAGKEVYRGDGGCKGRGGGA